VPALGVQRPPARGEHGAGQGIGKGWRGGNGTEREEHAEDLGAVDEMVVPLDLEELNLGHVEHSVRERESASRERSLHDGKGPAPSDGARERRTTRARCEFQVSGRLLQYVDFQEKVARPLVYEVAERVNACNARVEYGKGTHIYARKEASARSAGAWLLASMLVRWDEKLVAVSGVLIAAASAAGTHGEHVDLEDLAQVWGLT
jgi:hypothetical protein